MIRLFNNTLLKRNFSSWKNIPSGSIDPIMKLTEDFNKDTNKKKVNLAIGAYKDENNLPLVLNSVKKAKKNIRNKNHEYSSIIGNLDFNKNSKMFLFDKKIEELENVATVQTLSGTGACRLGAEFMNKVCGYDKIYLPNITWGNHIPIMKKSGLNLSTYSYYVNGSVNLQAIIDDLNEAPSKSLFLFHVCAHNPTGADPTNEEWEKILETIISNKHIILFDCAYQGFSSGDHHKDAFPVRFLFERKYNNFLVAQSYSKNFGLYGERIGALNIVTNNIEEKDNVISQLKGLIRPAYSNPPINGAKIINEIMQNETLFSEWETECLEMANRMNSMRTLLAKSLNEKIPDINWDHIKSQNGMFCFSGIPSEVIDILRENHSIYMTNDGRISIAGINEKNIDHITDSIMFSFNIYKFRNSLSMLSFNSSLDFKKS